MRQTNETKTIKNNPKIMKAWAFYDWANSVYSLVITSTIFPIYYSIITTAYEKNEFVAETGKWIKVPVRNMINIFGKELSTRCCLWLFAYHFVFIVVFISPILSSLADTIGNKKSFLQFFCYLGATSCMGLAMFTSMNNVFLRIAYLVLQQVLASGEVWFFITRFCQILQRQISKMHFPQKGMFMVILVLYFWWLFVWLSLCLWLRTPKEASIYNQS